MKKLVSLFITLACLLVVSAGAQSLADIAAQTRAKQKANPNAKVIDNDILPSVPDAASYGSPYETKKDDATANKTADSDEKKDADKKDADKSDKKDAEKAEKKDAEKKDGGKKDDEKTAEQKASDSLKEKIEDQQKQITQLQRELDVAQREARLRAAAYYADAGTMLRDQGKFAEDSRTQQAEIDAKTKALADARQKLDDLQEQARKSAMPSSVAGNSQ